MLQVLDRTSHALETTQTKAKGAALVAVGIPVVFFDRVSDQLNTRLDLDSYVELARERGEHALDGYGKQVHGVTRRMRSVVRPAVTVGAKLAQPLLHTAGRLVPDPVEARLGAALTSAKHLVAGVAEQIVPAKPAPTVAPPGVVGAAVVPKKSAARKAKKKSATKTRLANKSTR
jgi:hypothetical protein